MKCIRLVGTDHIVRMRDDDAHATVKAGKGEYVPKRLAKAQERAAAEPEETANEQG